MEEDEYVKTHMWGMFPTPKPKHEPETLEKQKRLEKLLFPVMDK